MCYPTARFPKFNDCLNHYDGLISRLCRYFQDADYEDAEQDLRLVLFLNWRAAQGNVSGKYIVYKLKRELAKCIDKYDKNIACEVPLCDDEDRILAVDEFMDIDKARWGYLQEMMA